MIITSKIGVNGMYCNGCETIIEAAVKNIDGVLSAKVQYKQSVVIVRFDDNKVKLHQIETAIASAGYSIHKTSSIKQKTLQTVISLSALILIITAIVLARKYGNMLSMPEINSKTSDSMIFIVGLLSGLHCIGMCGSLIIGYTSKEAKVGYSFYRSHILYGVGKTFSYAMLGFIFGYLGSLFHITPFISGVSICLAGAFIVLYGLSLLGLFSFLKYFQIKRFKVFSKIHKEKKRKPIGPLFIGFFSGFILGCGPLQVMYILAAGNGNALEGAKILTLFGLGTLPALFGFGIIARLLSNTMTKRFIQVSGIILIVLGFIMLNNGIKRTSTNNDVKNIHSCCHGNN